ncbi:MAG: RDD family protein [Bacteroidales bacterium]|nr:RDD family protein [Bacteroidales bacterium]MCF8404342.1 RDD family protein [Bacteroidales bacterium]
MNDENNMNSSEQVTRTYAGFWWRFLSHLIDQLIISAAMSIIILPLLGIFGVSLYGLSESGYDMEDPKVILGPLFLLYFVVIVFSITANWLYYAFMESSKNQGTIGKMVLKIKVTDYNYNRISFARATGRYFGKIISGLILYIGYIMAGFTDKKQALHDIIAGCYVIKE